MRSLAACSSVSRPPERLITCAPPKPPAAAPSPRIIAAIASAFARERSRASGTSSHSIETFWGFAASIVTGSVIPGWGQRLRCTRPSNSTAVGGTPSAWTINCMRHIE